MDDLFESTRRLVSAKAPEERRGIPRIEVVREALRGEWRIFAPLQHMLKTFSNPSNDKYGKRLKIVRSCS